MPRVVTVEFDMDVEFSIVLIHYDIIIIIIIIQLI